MQTELCSTDVYLQRGKKGVDVPVIFLRVRAALVFIPPQCDVKYSSNHRHSHSQSNGGEEVTVQAASNSRSSGSSGGSFICVIYRNLKITTFQKSYSIRDPYIQYNIQYK